ncbi:MAG: 5' nucleotidase, NT5C type [Peptostreptococcaceae bacterium]
MSKLNICIDIDGTITSPYHFIPYLNEIYNKNVKEEECNTYDWEVLYNVSMDEILHKLHNDYMHSYEEAEIVANAKNIIEDLKNNHNVYFVTARDNNLQNTTLKWLETRGFSQIEVYLLGSHYKIEKAKELNCDIFIEDSPSNAMDLAGAGMKVLLIDTYYNQDVEHENITRVNNWIEIERYIENYS